jgi:hypothetical protein
MSANVEFSITAFDEASDVFSTVQSNASECFTTVETGASEAADSVSASSSEIQSSVETSSFSLKDNALAMNNLALSGAGLVTSISSIENAETSLDRANVTVEKGTNAVQSAQERYNEVIAKYGPNSQQAADAADKLKAAQDSLNVAQERVDEAQRRVNDTIMMSSLTIIPSIITGFTSLNTLLTATPAIESAVATATGAVGTAMDFLAANPIVLVIAGIAALAIGLYYAFEHCKPFHDAVMAVANVLGGALSVAATAVSNAIGWLWNNVLKPFGEFLWNVFVNAYLKPLEAAWDALSSGIMWLWHNVLEPVASFFKGVFTEAINIAMAPIRLFQSAISAVSNAVKPLTDIIGGLGNALSHLCFAHAAPAAEEFNKQVTESISKADTLTNKLDPLKNSLLGVAGSANVGNVGLNSGTQHITVNPTINIGKIDRSTGLQDVVNSVNQGTALALQRRF